MRSQPFRDPGKKVNVKGKHLSKLLVLLLVLKQMYYPGQGYPNQLMSNLRKKKNNKITLYSEFIDYYYIDILYSELFIEIIIT